MSIRAITNDLPAAEVAALNLPEFLKAEELAKLLRVNRKTVYDAASRNEIPGMVRVGRVLRFRRDVVLAWCFEQG